MKISKFTATLLMSFGLFFLTKTASAIVLNPLDDPKISVPANTTSTLSYKIINNSDKIQILVMTPMKGVSQTFKDGSCSHPLTLDPNQSCTLLLKVKGPELVGPVMEGPRLCEQNNLSHCYQPKNAHRLNITVASPLEYAKISNSPLYFEGEDQKSKVIIYNDSTDVTATNIKVSFKEAELTNKITKIDSSCKNLAPGDSCTITFKNMESLLSGDLTSIHLLIAGDNTNVLGDPIFPPKPGTPLFGGLLGCYHKGDPNRLPCQLIVTDGKVTDAEWGGMDTSVFTTFDNGVLNSSNIIKALGNNDATPYAARLCRNYEVDAAGNTPCRPGVTCYNDWFLPALEQIKPIMQNDVVNGEVWSSTAPAEYDAWTCGDFFEDDDNPFPIRKKTRQGQGVTFPQKPIICGLALRDELLAVHCVRKVAPKK
ncbi:COG1470 family protein [Legionella septentrionalis]|uniref:DUF1566 domain-containing protein n=1 Tax=Legionella septentrionalis TaxID=2498109 RepID=A0A433JIT8_9GAMM|nr:hypothetical protein [Legionella septentrionalis]RUQ85290.1 hypothetical protein EKM59_07070 [Legionella septentrionalis]